MTAEFEDYYWANIPGISFGKYARCKGLDPEVFITPGPSLPVVQKVCRKCPAIIQCAMYGQQNNMSGVWGGLLLHATYAKEVGYGQAGVAASDAEGTAEVVRGTEEG